MRMVKGLIFLDETRRNKVDFVNLREKFSPGPGFEPRSPALRPGALTN